MSQSVRDFEKSFVCGATTLIAKQYYAVKQHTDGTLILAAAGTDKIVGILQNKPAVGVAALVRFAGTSKAKAGGTIAVGAWVTATSDGTVIATTTNKDVVIGKYLGAASASTGDIIEIQLGIFTLSA